MNVLLSHINEETQIASILKQWIESSLDHDVQLSGEANIRLDQERLLEVDRALGEARVVLLLCSPWSIGRPWINFESGCAWFKGVPVIAVCHCGCSPADLAPPLGNFHALDLADAASCQALVETLAKLLQKKRIPRINYDLMVAELGGTVEPGEVPAPSAPPAEPSNGAPEPAAKRLRRTPKAARGRRGSRAKRQPIEVRLLATMQHLPDFSCTATRLAAGLGEQETAVRDSLTKLLNNQLLIQKVSTHPSDPDTRYAFTEEGRRYLAKHSR